MSALIRNLAIDEKPLRLSRMHAASASECDADQTHGLASRDESQDLVSLPTQQGLRPEADVLIEAAREQAVREGYEQGLSRGHQEALQHNKQKFDALNRLLESVPAAMAGQIDGLEDVALHIAMTAVMKILGDTLVSPGGIRAVVQQVLRQVRTSEPMAMRLAPQDFYFLLKQKSNAELSLPPNIELMPDDRVELGGCILDAAGGGIDARIETQLARLRDVLVKARAARGGGS